MIALRIKNVKHFMSQFLGGDAFDSFLLEQASISTYCTFTIDGRENRAFYTSEEWDFPVIPFFGGVERPDRKTSCRERVYHDV